jgi:transposase
VFYDVTTLYFEASKEDELRRLGYSKDGKAHKPQIVLGLLVSKGGYPLAFDIHKGNQYEGNTLIPILDRFKSTYNLAKLIVVADSGLLSNSNIKQLIENDYEFILGARIKSESTKTKERILGLDWSKKHTHILYRPKMT